MRETLDLKIRTRLAQYVAGEIPLSEFHDWLTRATWDVPTDADPALRDLVYQLKLRLAEFTNGHWAEDELIALFRPFLERYSFSVGVHTATASTSSFATPSEASRPTWLVRTPPAAASS